MRSLYLAGFAPVRRAMSAAVNALGPGTADSGARRDREHGASSIAAYRKMRGYGHPDDPIGPQPGTEAPDQRAACRRSPLTVRPAAGTPPVAAADLRRGRTAEPHRPPPAATRRRQPALGHPDHRRQHPAQHPHTQLIRPKRPYDQEGNSRAPGTPPARRNSRAIRRGHQRKQSTRPVPQAALP